MGEAAGTATTSSEDGPRTRAQPDRLHASLHLAHQVTSVGLGVRTSVSVIIPCNMSHELGISLLPGDVQKEPVRRENSHLMILRPTTKASSSSPILSHREWQVPGDEKSTTGVRRRR
ncbi:hypothetical protein CTAM01_12899 [Colletotrichum tamarilloi]|uniref:Uncharacterized protein n=1 Tax=Colletotrichum tamarilloi TaxID=1209934 RepID=A0ABQ9QTM6_9PEZI|nr:uncharacterized protein CTAM01_12899 [Colletotrichum tamarilloi]KAK1484655.1 hypothetical protein CTAM01_12899 [Colletotrichum tamarilloi]